MERREGDASETVRETENIGQGPILKREAMFVPRDSGRLAFVFAMCTLAGVAMGFGIRGVSTSCPAARHQQAATAPVVRAAPGCAKGCTWLGIQMVDTRDGVRVVHIFDESPAADLHTDGLLAPGDYIYSVAGRRINRAADVVAQIHRRAPGDRVSMRLRRPGQQAVVMLEAELGWITSGRFRRLARD